MDSDESTEIGVFPEDHTLTIHITDQEIATKPTVETVLANDRANATKDIEHSNDKTTAAKIDGSDSDKNMITLRSRVQEDLGSKICLL